MAFCSAGIEAVHMYGILFSEQVKLKAFCSVGIEVMHIQSEDMKPL